MSGRYERKKPQKAGGWKKPVLIAVLIVVILIAALVVAAVVYYNSMLNKMNQVQVPTISRTEPPTEPDPDAPYRARAEEILSGMLLPVRTISIFFWLVRLPVRERLSGLPIP